MKLENRCSCVSRHSGGVSRKIAKHANPGHCLQQAIYAHPVAHGQAEDSLLAVPPVARLVPRTRQNPCARFGVQVRTVEMKAAAVAVMKLYGRSHAQALHFRLTRDLLDDGLCKVPQHLQRNMYDISAAGRCANASSSTRQATSQPIAQRHKRMTENIACHTPRRGPGPA